ncbi:MAG TPA: Flp family type IVb pilin [Burkholderiaceae bacterium]|jgi:pilus assembly protein Flp/PilA|nr:Flp family type IVb pilin [Burkholderiaceae bacterium]
MFHAVTRFLNDEEGVSAVEYGLVAALIAVAIGFTVHTLGLELDATFQKIVDCLGGSC